MKPLLVAYHPAFLEHDAGPTHPESPARVKAAMRALAAVPWAGMVIRVEVRAATAEEIAWVHAPEYIESVRRLCASGGQYVASLEANLGPASWEAALRAVGAGLTLADHILTGAGGHGPTPPTIGFAPVRPPGHHAARAKPMGFCIFNNVAILAKYLREKHRLQRVAVLDFDVHHGNGTEDAFWQDPSVMFCSLHRDNHYPYGRGAAADAGEGPGQGFTINIPLPAESGDERYRRAVEEVVLPRLTEFAPEFVLVSAGFDAHRLDPLGGMNLTAEGYRMLGEAVARVASVSAAGRVISVLEGGYHPEGIAEGLTAYLEGLLAE